MFPIAANLQEEQEDEIVLPFSQISEDPVAPDMTASTSPPHMPVSTEHTIDSDVSSSIPEPIAHRSERLKQPSIKLRDFHLFHTTKVASSQSSS